MVGKDAYSLRNIESVLRPAEEHPPEEEFTLIRKAKVRTPKGGVLVVGVGSLMTQLAKCCRPAPRRDRWLCDARQRCERASLRLLQLPRNVGQESRTVIEVGWDLPKNVEKGGALYPVDVAVEAADRQGLLRDISDVFAREKTNVIGVQTQSVKGTAWMTFTVEVADSGRLNKVLAIVASVSGVRSARRR